MYTYYQGYKWHKKDLETFLVSIKENLILKRVEEFEERKSFIPAPDLSSYSGSQFAITSITHHILTFVFNIKSCLETNIITTLYVSCTNKSKTSTFQCINSV